MDLVELNKLHEALRADGRYPLDAFEFLHEGLAFTTSQVHGDEDPERPRHVSGQQLCQGLRDYAIERWGRLARLVLARWNINATEDFGQMVFLLVNLGVLGKQDSDNIEDFTAVFDFNAAFAGYQIPVKPLARAPLNAV